MSEYYTLLTALPHLPKLDGAVALPISRLSLESRLNMLDEADSYRLGIIEQLYFSDYKSLTGLADREVVHAWQTALSQLDSDVMKARISYQLEIRTLLAALRYREEGAQNPDHFVGFGRWHSFIKNHWFEPFFGLDEYQPQLQKLVRFLKDDKPGQAEKVLGQMLWQDLLFSEKQQGFSFDAVACYVLRWGLMSQLLSADPGVALSKFSDLTQSLLKGTSLIEDLDQESLNR